MSPLKQALEEVACIVKPDTILAWHRKLIAQKFDGSNSLLARLPSPNNMLQIVAAMKDLVQSGEERIFVDNNGDSRDLGRV